MSNIGKWLNSLLLIINKVSFACHKTILKKLSANLQKLTSTYDKMCSSINICLIGHFQQLEQIGGRNRHISILIQFIGKSVKLQGKFLEKCPDFTRAFPISRTKGITTELCKMFNSIPRLLILYPLVERRGWCTRMPLSLLTKRTSSVLCCFMPPPQDDCFGIVSNCEYSKNTILYSIFSLFDEV